jgi:hypothetical protein
MDIDVGSGGKRWQGRAVLAFEFEADNAFGFGALALDENVDHVVVLEKAGESNAGQAGDSAENRFFPEEVPQGVVGRKMGAATWACAVLGHARLLI